MSKNNKSSENRHFRGQNPTGSVVRSYDPLSAGGQSRRDFIGGAGKALAATATASTVGFTAGSSAQSGQQSTTAIELVINGSPVTVEVEDRWTLAELLRDQLDLTGTKIGCNRSECGACTVIMNGDPVYACSQLAVWADGATIETIEGLAENGELSPLQQAFVENNGPQCGFCTPGQLMTATALLDSTTNPNARQVREAMVGNLCRCSNYNAIIEAVLAASGQGGVA